MGKAKEMPAKPAQAAAKKAQPGKEELEAARDRARRAKEVAVAEQLLYCICGRRRVESEQDIDAAVKLAVYGGKAYVKEILGE